MSSPSPRPQIDLDPETFDHHAIGEIAGFMAHTPQLLEVDDYGTVTFRIPAALNSGIAKDIRLDAALLAEAEELDMVPTHCMILLMEPEFRGDDRKGIVTYAHDRALETALTRQASRGQFHCINLPAPVRGAVSVLILVTDARNQHDALAKAETLITNSEDCRIISSRGRGR